MTFGLPAAAFLGCATTTGGQPWLRGDDRPFGVGVGVGVGEDAEVIGEDVRRRIADDLGGLGVGDARGPSRLQPRVVDAAAPTRDGAGQGRRCGSVRVGGLPVAGTLQFLGVGLADVCPYEGVSGQAVLAIVVLGGGARQSFPDGT
ncbi:hypothetical protein ACWD5V_37345 [Streptomyces sp. NPDC002523]